MHSKIRSFKTVSHKHLQTINNNESKFFGSKMGQTNHKTLRTREFIRFFANKVKKTMKIVSKSLFRLLGTMYCSWCLDYNGLNSQKMKYSKKKIVWNVLENNWLKSNLKILCYNYFWLTLWQNIKNKLWKIWQKILWSVIPYRAFSSSLLRAMQSPALFSIFFQILYIFAQVFKYFALFALSLTFFCPFSEKSPACPYFIEYALPYLGIMLNMHNY